MHNRKFMKPNSVKFFSESVFFFSEDISAKFDSDKVKSNHCFWYGQANYLVPLPAENKSITNE